MNAHPDSPLSIPVARRNEQVREIHGDRRVDSYAWLCDVAKPAVVAHLAAERAYYEASTAHLRPLVDRLTKSMRSRVPETDSSVSYRRTRFSYYNLTPAGSEYEQLWRGSDVTDGVGDRPGDGDVMLLDPASLLGDSAYVDVGINLISPDERLLAYSVDTVGGEVFELRFRDLEAMDGPSDLDDVVTRSYYGGAWSADSSSFFYTVHDAAYRPHEVWRHVLGTSPDDDTLVLAEPDEQFELDLRATRSGQLILITAANRITAEVWVVDAEHPDRPARCVQLRERGVEYTCDHVRTAIGDRLFIVTNLDAQEFRLMSAPLATPGRENWVEVLPENPAERLYDVTAFAGYVVTTLRRDTVLMARSYCLGADGGLSHPVDLTPSDPHGTLELAHNEVLDTTELQVVEQSWTQPRTWLAVDLRTGARRQLLAQNVPAYDVEQYVSDRRVVRVGEVDVPCTIVRHVDTPLDGSAPGLLYGYGAYESCFEPEFDAALSTLLDSGVVWVHAGIRGGGEGGRRWWLDGRLAAKHHTFDDHIAVANFLADGVVDGERIVTRGLSAGGLLQGAVFSQTPARWAGVIAEVPFVDVITTLLDASIPLTANEWDEWGDPREAADYEWMRRYSPYDNVPPAGVRPDLLVTGALHDPRVMVCEPAKWVAELRYSDPDWSPRCLFRAEVSAGAHVGPSGRYAHLRYEAEIYAWAMERLGLT